MEYTKREVSRDLVRAEVLNYLRENRDKFRFSGLSEAAIAQGNAIAADIWRRHVSEIGAYLPDFVDQVHRRLHSSGKVARIPVPVNDSIVASTCDLYETTRITYLILEEIVECMHSGVLIELAFLARTRQATGSLDFRLGEGRLVLTEFGDRYVADALAVTHSTEEYFDILRQTKEPDDVLKGYLSEGLACLRHRLPRAAAVLLRLAAEHTLDLLVQSTEKALNSNEKASKSFQTRINKTRREGLEAWAQTIFKKLESTKGLVPHSAAVTNRLKAAFHQIRHSGGRAAHLSEPILPKVVRDDYALFANSVYTIVMDIIEHQSTMP